MSRRRRAKPRDNAQESVEPVDSERIRRRTLFKRMALAGTALGAGALGISYLAAQDHRWRFLEDPCVPHPTLDQLLTWVPVGPHSHVVIGSVEFERVRPSYELDIQRIVTQQGFDPRTPWEAQIKKHLYLHAGIPQQINGYASYHERAITLTHLRLAGTTPLPFQWHAVQSGDDVRTDYTSKVFVGSKVGVLYSVDTLNKNNPSQGFTCTYVGSINGATCQLQRDSTGNLLWWFHALTPGPHALNAPFSEYIPLLTSQATARYARTVGDPLADRADETFSESVSHVLAKDLATELVIPGSAKIIDDLLTDIARNPLYDRVPRGINLIRRIGVQQAFGLYIEDPGRFMSEVERS